jgi:hypothetical protein
VAPGAEGAFLLVSNACYFFYYLSPLAFLAYNRFNFNPHASWGQGSITMLDFSDELRKLLLLPDDNARDEELFAFVERVSKDDPESAINAAKNISELYKRGWALLLCVKALVHIDIEKAVEVAEIIEDEYNRLRARHTIEFTEAKQKKREGFDPSWN